MNAESPLILLDQIEAAIDELRPSMCFGPTTKHADIGGLLVPLVATPPAHPTLIALIQDGRARIEIRWVEAVHRNGEAENVLAAIAGFFHMRLTKTRRVPALLALRALETNFIGRTSAAGYVSETGEIFVRDLLCPVNGILIGTKESLRSIVEHARDIIQFATMLWSDGFVPPERPDSPLDA